MLEITDGDGGVAATLSGVVSDDELRRLIHAQPAHVTVNSGGVGDLAFLPRLPLRELDLVRFMPGTPIAPVNFVTGLTRLNISSREYTGTLNLAGLTDLGDCFLEWGAGAESVLACSSLRFLYVTMFPGSDLTDFASLPKLRTLRVGNSRRLVRVGDLASAALRGVGLYYCTKLTSIEGLPTDHLVSFDAEVCKAVTDWDVVAQSPALRYVGLQNLGPLPSIRPFEDAKLEFFWFPESTDVQDGRVAWLGDVPTLRNTGFQNRRHYDATRQELGARIAARHGDATWYPPAWETL
jgi:hypothetical protein